MTALTKVEQNELMRLERIVEKNMQATRDWCEALCAIKDRKLYRDGYASWGDYCHRRHSISPQWANAKMLAEAVRKSETAVSLSDKAALEASKIEDSSERREILEEAAAQSNGSPTAPAIRRLREKRKPKITAEDLAAASDARRKGQTPAPLTDSVGRTIPDRVRNVFEDGAAEFKELQKRVQSLRKDVATISEMPFGLHLHAQQADIELKNVWNAIKFATPYAVCPKCKASGKCDTCKEKGWLPKLLYNAVPSEYREAVEDDE